MEGGFDHPRAEVLKLPPDLKQLERWIIIKTRPQEDIFELRKFLSEKFGAVSQITVHESDPRSKEQILADSPNKDDNSYPIYVVVVFNSPESVIKAHQENLFPDHLKILQFNYSEPEYTASQIIPTPSRERHKPSLNSTTKTITCEEAFELDKQVSLLLKGVQEHESFRAKKPISKTNSVWQVFLQHPNLSAEVLEICQKNLKEYDVLDSKEKQKAQKTRNRSGSKTSKNTQKTDKNAQKIDKNAQKTDKNAPKTDKNAQRQEKTPTSQKYKRDRGQSTTASSSETQTTPSATIVRDPPKRKTILPLETVPEQKDETTNHNEVASPRDFSSPRDLPSPREDSDTESSQDEEIKEKKNNLVRTISQIIVRQVLPPPSNNPSQAPSLVNDNDKENDNDKNDDDQVPVDERQPVQELRLAGRRAVQQAAPPARVENLHHRDTSSSIPSSTPPDGFMNALRFGRTSGVWDAIPSELLPVESSDERDHCFKLVQEAFAHKNWDPSHWGPLYGAFEQLNRSFVYEFGSTRFENQPYGGSTWAWAIFQALFEAFLDKIGQKVSSVADIQALIPEFHKLVRSNYDRHLIHHEFLPLVKEAAHMYAKEKKKPNLERSKLVEGSLLRLEIHENLPTPDAKTLIENDVLAVLTPCPKMASHQELQQWVGFVHKLINIHLAFHEYAVGFNSSEIQLKFECCVDYNIALHYYWTFKGKNLVPVKATSSTQPTNSASRDGCAVM